MINSISDLWLSVQRVAIVIFLFAPSIANADSLLNAVKKDNFLKFGNVSIVEHEHEKYLISIGVSALDSSNLSNWKKARIESKLLSQQQLSKFINDVNINALEAVEEVLVISITDKGIKTRKVDSKYIEYIKEKSEGPLTNIITIGDWSDQNNYYYAIGKKLARQ